MQSAGQQVTVSALLSSWFGVLGRHTSVCLLAGGLLTALGTLFDISLGEKSSQLISGIASFFLQYHLVEYLLVHEFGLRPGKRRYGSAFAASFLVTLGSFGALLLLIVPGLYVGARWSLSSALIIGEGYTSIDAMRESWRRTQASAWSLVGCFLIVGLCLGASIVGLAAILMIPGVKGPFFEPLAGNFLGGVIAVTFAALSCAVYGLISKPEGALDDVFS